MTLVGLAEHSAVGRQQAVSAEDCAVFEPVSVGVGQLSDLWEAPEARPNAAAIRVPIASTTRMCSSRVLQASSAPSPAVARMCSAEDCMGIRVRAWVIAAAALSYFPRTESRISSAAPGVGVNPERVVLRCQDCQRFQRAASRFQCGAEPGRFMSVVACRIYGGHTPSLPTGS